MKASLALTVVATSIARALAALEGIPGTLGPFDQYSKASCWVSGDPHYYPFHGGRYDFHGGCDTILVRATPVIEVEFEGLNVPLNFLLEIHLRTTEVDADPPFSEITAVAARLGVEVPTQGWQLIDFEVRDYPTFGLYMTPPGGTPTQIRWSQDFITPVGVFEYTRGAAEHRIALGSADQYFVVGLGTGGYYVHLGGAFGAGFDSAVGMCGTWQAPSGGLVGRNGVTYGVSVAEGEQFGSTWQVKSSDPQLFSTPAQPECFALRRRYLKEVQEGKRPARRHRNVQETNTTGVVDPVAACADVPDDIRGQKQACEYDVEVTEDESWGTSPTYTEVKVDPEEPCVENSEDEPCAAIGGRTVWRCNEQTNDCDASLAMASAGFEETSDFPLSPGAIEGCACATQNSDLCPSVSGILHIIGF